MVEGERRRFDRLYRGMLMSGVLTGRYESALLEPDGVEAVIVWVVCQVVVNRLTAFHGRHGEVWVLEDAF